MGKGDKISQNKHKINHKIGVYQTSPHLNQACPHAKIKKEAKGINIYSMQTSYMQPIYMQSIYMNAST